MAFDAASSPLLSSFRASYGDLLRYLARRTSSADEARDLVHDTWLRVADMARQGREPALGDDGQARAYLFTLARNLAIDHQRRGGMAQRHTEGQQAAAAVAERAYPDVADAAMYGQAIQAVEAALAGLPPRARDIFLRHRLHGEDQGALAAAFGISRNMVERDMMLAMDRVQAAMERWHAGAPASEAAAACRRSGRRRSLGMLLGAAGMALGGTAGWRWWRLAVPQWQKMAATGHGRTLRQPLPDGSAVALDADSRVALAYYAGRRSARLLAGAAFFEVAADAARPFVVGVPPEDSAAADLDGGLRVTVLGTRFGVERLPGGALEVQVESGRVRVQAPGGIDRELAAGDALRWTPGDGSGTNAAPALRRLDSPQAAAAWRHGLLLLDQATLGDTVERLRRYLPRPVDVAPDAAALRLSGQVRIAQAEDFLRALPGIVPVRSRLEDGRWRVASR